MERESGVGEGRDRGKEREIEERKGDVVCNIC